MIENVSEEAFEALNNSVNLGTNDVVSGGMSRGLVANMMPRIGDGWGQTVNYDLDSIIEGQLNLIRRRYVEGTVLKYEAALTVPEQDFLQLPRYNDAQRERVTKEVKATFLTLNLN